jgi:sec-independent protein translocase protein TatC
MTFLDRVDDVRMRLFRAAVVLVIGTAAGFWVAMNYNVLGFFTRPVMPFLGGQRLKYLDPVDPFYITFQLALCIGVLVTLPYLLRQLWLLIEPMLLAGEKRLVRFSILGGVAFFFAGVFFCYYLTLPLILRFTMGFQTESLEQSVVVSDYLAMVLRLMGAFGIAFELPILVLLGTVLGVVTPQFLVEKRRYAIAIVMILSAVVTPADVSSMLLLAIPAMVLYEIGILLSRMFAGRPALMETAGEA